MSNIKVEDAIVGKFVRIKGRACFDRGKKYELCKIVDVPKTDAKLGRGSHVTVELYDEFLLKPVKGKLTWDYLNSASVRYTETYQKTIPIKALHENHPENVVKNKRKKLSNENLNFIIEVIKSFSNDSCIEPPLINKHETNFKMNEVQRDGRTSITFHLSGQQIARLAYVLKSIT